MLSRPHFLPQGELLQHELLLRLVRDRRHAQLDRRFRDAVVVGEDEVALLAIVIAEPEDPLLLHQPRDEVEMRLAVLHPVLVRVVRLDALRRDIREALILAHGLDDVRDRHVLKRPEVGGKRQEPEPRPQLRLIHGEALRLLELYEFANQAVDDALTAVAERHLHRRRGADQLRRANARILAEHAKGVTKAVGDPVLAFEALEQQRVWTEDGIDTDRASLLRIGQGRRDFCLRGHVHTLQSSQITRATSALRSLAWYTTVPKRLVSPPPIDRRRDRRTHRRR